MEGYFEDDINDDSLIKKRFWGYWKTTSKAGRIPESVFYDERHRNMLLRIRQHSSMNSLPISSLMLVLIIFPLILMKLILMILRMILILVQRLFVVSFGK